MRKIWPIAFAAALLAACSQPSGDLKPQVAVGPALAVEKTAVPHFQRTYRWTLEKRVLDPTSGELTLSPGQTYTLRYRVVARAQAEDSGYRVTGQVVFRNTGTGTVYLQAPTDTLSTNESVALDCGGVSFPYALAEGASLTCTYAQNLTDGRSRINTAQVAWGTDGTSFPNTAQTQASFAFTNPTEVVDETAQLNDTLGGALGTVTASGTAFQQAFEYTHQVRYDQCGNYRVDNRAHLQTTDTGTEAHAEASVPVRVPCQGCTLTQGYWKTHSREGPAPYDAAWQNLGPLEEDTLFFTLGQTWYAVFWTAPRGNAYYILAHQYMAAKLNVLDGASAPPEVLSALSGAEALFNSLPAGSTALTSAQRSQALAWASLLDSYNNGLVGPGHCSE